ncbi:YtxH domain-containing protein [Schnuerera sp.]|uniref:YtxH domain-containing protein n=1 Tax=Schnuerera sp. TaxID=2794844 RepID=UPI002CAC5E73|nr:YtxH domain-containing protein [Schnuerera sp.]HSH35928.1 YtxH domain-containing protein [Schnuerera sp.]
MKLIDLLNEKKKKAERQEKVDTAKKIAIGTAIGAITGILFAPKSGKETREDIAKKTKETTETVKKSVKDSVESIKEVEGKVRDDIKDKVREFKERDMIEVEIEEGKIEEEDPEKNQEM